MLLGNAVRSVLEAHGIPLGRIGTAGLSVLPLRQFQDLHKALSPYQIEDASALLQNLRATPRPRERTAVAIALAMAADAACAAELAFANGASNAGAVVEAERTARLAGAWDVRILANLTGIGLRPYEAPSDARHVPFSLWIAARYQGCWADQVVGSSPQAASALTAMLGAARPGAPAREVASAGLAALPDEVRDQALSRGSAAALGWN